jgi:hypothetical protein
LLAGNQLVTPRVGWGLCCKGRGVVARIGVEVGEVVGCRFRGRRSWSELELTIGLRGLGLDGGW